MINQPYFYHETIRNTIVAFGSIFSDIHIQRRDDNECIQDIRVPISYAPKRAFLKRLQQDPKLNALTQIDLPRMSFEITGYNYDATRKVNKVHSIVADTNGTKQQFSPAPYNIDIRLYVYTKTQEDGLMIIEQIFPYFTPEFTVTINVVPEMEITQDVPFVLSTTTPEDNYTEGFEKSSIVINTLAFTAKTNIFGPVVRKEAIKISDVNIRTSVLNGFTDFYQAAVIPKQANKNDPHTIVETT